MTIKQKLTGGLWMGLSALGIIIGMAVWSQQRLTQSITSLDVELEKMALMTTLQLRINESVMPANDFIITGKAEYRETFTRLDAQVDKAFSAVLGSSAFGNNQKSVIAKCRSFYDGLRETSATILSRNHRDPGLPALMEKMDYAFAAPAIATVEELRAGIDASVQQARSNAVHVRKLTFIIFLSLAIAVIGLGLFFSIILIRSIIVPINATVGMLQEIAEGHGDMTRRLPVKGNDEIGQLAYWFNRFVEGMQGIIRSIVATTGDISAVSASLHDSSATVMDTTRLQMRAAEETSSSTLQMQSAIRSIAGDAGSLTTMTEGAAASSAQMSATVRMLADVSAEFDGMAIKVASSITEVAASTRQISGNVDSLSVRSDAIVTAITEINSALKAVKDHSIMQAELAERTREVAKIAGIEAVDQARAGMEDIRREASEAADVVAHLGKMTDEIKKVATFVEEVTDATALVALNASILAAQAGAHGKGFAVLADEIKNLSRRNAASTAQITGRIREVVACVTDAVCRIEATLTTVGKGIRLSDHVRQCLEEIVTSSDQTLVMARTVQSALTEQAAAMIQITDNVNGMDQMVTEVRKATEEQTNAATDIARTTEEMTLASRTISGSLAEQAREVAAFAAMVAEANVRMEAISCATGQQNTAAASIAEAIDTIRQQSERHVSLAEELGRLVSVLDTGRSTLGVQVQGFKV